MRRIAVSTTFASLLILALVLSSSALLVGCGGGSPSDSGNNNANNGKGGKANSNNATTEPPRVETYTASLPEFPNETPEEKQWREVFNATVKSIGGEIPKDYRDEDALKKVMKDPAKWVEANETLQSTKNKLSRGRFQNMTERPVENLNKLVNEARNALLEAPRGGPFIATEKGFEDANNGKTYEDPEKYPIMMKAMKLIRDKKYSQALDMYGFGPDFPEALVKDADRATYDRKVFASFRGNIIYAIFWNLIGEDVELEFERGRLGDALEYVSESYLEKMDKDLYAEVKAKTTDTRMDGNGKVRTAATQMQQFVMKRINATYQKLIGEISGPVSASLSSSEGAPMTKAEIGKLETRANEIVAQIKKWGIQDKTNEAMAYLNDQWKPAFETLRKKAKE
ncbi:MAG: hypothetical protein AB7K09_10940 [Planctomycetota bacterium]